MFCAHLIAKKRFQFSTDSLSTSVQPGHGIKAMATVYTFFCFLFSVFQSLYRFSILRPFMWLNYFVDLLNHHWDTSSHNYCHIVGACRAKNGLHAKKTFQPLYTLSASVQRSVCARRTPAAVIKYRKAISHWERTPRKRGRVCGSSSPVAGSESVHFVFDLRP